MHFPLEIWLLKRASFPGAAPPAPLPRLAAARGGPGHGKEHIAKKRLVATPILVGTV